MTTLPPELIAPFNEAYAKAVAHAIRHRVPQVIFFDEVTKEFIFEEPLPGVAPDDYPVWISEDWDDPERFSLSMGAPIPVASSHPAFDETVRRGVFELLGNSHYLHDLIDHWVTPQFCKGERVLP